MMPVPQIDDGVRMDSSVRMPDSFDKERERIHRQMMSSVSHDLKTPLASIIGSLEIHERMKEKLKPGNKQALIDMALQEAYRLDNFITNILDMAKLENGQVKFKNEQCNIGGLLQDCITQVAPRLKESDVRINGISGPISANTDPTLLQRAIGLLLDNAVKHGGMPSVISIIYGKEKDTGLNFVSVRDQGIGISDSMKEAIFSKYTRFVKQDKQNAGTGLGLAICREIMRLLKGSVEVENHFDGGALFTLKFPSIA